MVFWPRPSWHSTFMNVAEIMARRATCTRRHVGAVLVRDTQILATGYNGAPRGAPHCEDEGVGCLLEGDHCIRAVHAEVNAILQAARHGTGTVGTTLYTTYAPCERCALLIAQAGICEVVYLHGEMAATTQDLFTVREIRHDGYVMRLAQEPYE